MSVTMNYLISDFFLLFGKHQVLLIDKTYARHTGIAYAEPYQVASIVILSQNITYAKNRLCICSVNQ